jgi:hypothetical protein
MKIPKILLIVGAVSLALSIVFRKSYSMLTDEALYKIDKYFTTFNGRINEDPLTTTEQETLSRLNTLREVNPNLYNQIIDECTSKNPQAGRSPISWCIYTNTSCIIHVTDWRNMGYS